MKWIVPFLIISIFAESTAAPYPITLILFIIIAVGLGNQSLWWAFAIGIILDFLAIRLLGISSLYFLAVSFIIIRYQQKINLGSKIYAFSFILAATSAYSLLFYRNVTLTSIIATTGIGLVWLLLSPRLFPDTIGNKKKLAV